MARHEAEPETWQAPLEAELSAVGAGDDANLVAAAQALMGLEDQAGARAGKYVVTIRNSKGVQVVTVTRRPTRSVRSSAIRPAGLSLRPHRCCLCILIHQREHAREIVQGGGMVSGVPGTRARCQLW